MHKTILGVVAIVLVVGSLCSEAHAQPFESHFKELRTGENRATVMALMGEPTAQVDALTFGLPRAEARWVVGSRIYVAEFILDRLVSKRICQAVPNC